jgi:DNA-binding transcriptional regulator YiaG
VRKSFADQIVAHRKSEGLSQSQAAEDWGVSVRTLQKWEIGESCPSPFIAKCILFYLTWRKIVPGKKKR